MQWFRWYHGTCADPKLGGIARKSGQPKPVVIAIWAMCLESASEGDERGMISLAAEDIADTLDIEIAAVDAVLCALRERGLLNDAAVTAWEKRQPTRDDSADRVRRYREKHSVTGDGNAHVTPPDTDTEKDTEQNIPPKPPKGAAEEHPAFPAFWAAYPSRGGAPNPRKPASEKFVAALRKGANAEEIIHGVRSYAEYCRRSGIDGSERVSQAVTFLNQERWRDMQARDPPRLPASRRTMN